MRITGNTGNNANNVITDICYWIKDLIHNYQAFIATAVLSFVFAIFIQFGYELDTFDTISFLKITL